MMKILTITDTRGRQHSINVDQIERFVETTGDTEIRLLSGYTIRVKHPLAILLDRIERLPSI